MADVRVGVKIQAAIEGLAQVRSMVQSIDGLGNEGQAAAAQLDALTRELEEIARTQGLIQTFKQQKQALAEVSREYTNARQRSSELGQALKQTADPTRRQTQEFEKARAATRQFSQAQQQAQQALQQSRGALQQAGVSTQQLATAQRQLSTRSTEANTKLQSLNTQVRQLAAAKPAPDVTKNLRSGADSAGGAIRGVTKLLGAIGVTVGLAQVISQFTDAAKSAQRFERALTAITGSAAEAEAAQQRLSDLAEKYGTELVGLEDGYVSWRAAVEGTNLAGEESEKIFSAVVGSMSALGRSTADTEGVLLALQQMVSKGTVSMEELRQQLGERLPGAFQLAAKAMGVSTEELNKLVASGKVMAEDLLPGLARELSKAYGLDTVDRIETMGAAQNRLTNSVTAFFRAADDATGATGLLSRAIDGAADFIGTLADEMGGAKDEQKGLTGEIKAGEQARGKLIEDADAAAVAMERQAAAAREAKDAQRDLNQEARDQAIATLRGEMELLSQAWERQNATIEQARAGIDILLDQGYSELDTAVRNQRAVVDVAEQSQANLGRRYNDTAQQIREILNPALREQAEAQADAAEAADEGAVAVEQQMRRMQTAAKDLGVSFDAAFGRVSAGVIEAKDQLLLLVESGRFSARQISDAFSGMLEKAETEQDIIVLRALLESIGNQGVISGQQAAAGLEAINAKLAEIRESTQGTVQAIGGIAAAFDGSAESMNAVADQLEALTAKHREHAKAAASGQAEVKQALDETSESSQILVGDLEGAIPLWDAMSSKAQQAIVDTGLFLGGVTKEAATASAGLQNLIDRFETLGAGSSKYYSAGETAFGAYVEQLRQVQRQLAEAEGIQQRLNSAQADGTLSLQDLDRWAGIAANQLGQLGDETLAPLRRSIEDARQRLIALRDQAADTVNSLRAELAGLRGDELAVQEIRNAERLAELQQQLAEAEAAGNRDAAASYRDAIRLLKQINKEKLRQIEDEKQLEQARRQAGETSARAAEREEQARRRISGNRTGTPAGTFGPATGASTVANPAEIGAAVAAALNNAPIVIQIDGEALTGSIVQRLLRDAGRAN